MKRHLVLLGGFLKFTNNGAAKDAGRLSMVAMQIPSLGHPMFTVLECRVFQYGIDAIFVPIMENVTRSSHPMSCTETEEEFFLTVT